MENKNNLIGITTVKKTKQNTKKLSRFYTLFLYFLLFSFMGWLLETLYGIYELGHFTKRGFLYGPLCPIYGFRGITFNYIF